MPGASVASPCRRPASARPRIGLAAAFAGLVLGPVVGAQTAKPAPPAAAQGATTRYLPDRFAAKAGEYYRMVWGIRAPAVKLTESDELVRFSWLVLDARRAAPLSDAASTPSLIDPQAGVSLVVPAMENVGLLRQTATPEEGRSYWVTFSNKGRLVKRGDRVNVVIGTFHAEGLMVD